MNTINFNQIGGFPLTTNVLGKLQSAYSIFNALGSIVGDKTIISGCTVAGTNVSDGVVYVNGEIIEFKGGVIQPKVVIREDSDSLLFQNNNSYPVVKTRYVTFGVGTGSIDWTDFKRPIETKQTPNNLTARLEELEKKVAVFSAGGGMILWNKPAILIPPGWAEVIDWRGRMPVGFDASEVEFDVLGEEGGSKNKTLSIAELPPISFTYKKAVPGRGYRTAADDYPLSGLEDATTPPVGGGQAFSLLNPYRVVYFIEYIG